MLLKKVPVLFFLLLNTLLFSQTQFSGIVKDENQKPLSGATIMLSKDSTSAILSYAITDSAGKFKMNISAEATSLLLKVSFLGYRTLEKTYSNKDQDLEVELEPSSEELKEVLVRSEILEQRGDTLSFSVAAFQGKEDRVIADVLKKIPGIEILPNGQIQYQGKPIRKYYIEGLDLLEGRYNLANENLNAEAVSKVQILENHQPIKVLDSLEFSERASINIKLKNEVTGGGPGEVGSGFRPLLCKVNATPMLFTKKRQAIISYQTNNTGNDLSREIMDFSFESFGSNLNTNEQDLLFLAEASEPPFSKERWLDNQSHLGSINYLTKLKNDLELKVNLTYLNDAQKQYGSRNTRFFTGNDTISIFENSANQFFSNAVNGKFILEKNEDKNYLKNKLELKGNWASGNGELLRSGALVEQGLKTPFKAIENSFMLLNPVGKQLVTFNSNTAYMDSEENLLVQPGQFPNLLNDSIPYSITEQVLEKTEFFTNNSAGIRKALGKFNISPKIGFYIREQNLESNLYGIATEAERNYRNDLQLNSSEFYLDNTINYKSDDETWNLRLRTDLAYKNFSSEDGFYPEERKLSRLIFEPNFFLNKKLSALWETEISAGLNYNFGDISRLYRGYVLTNYRNLQRYDAPISETRSENYRYNLRYRNALKQIFISGSYSFQKNKNNLLYASFIDAFGAGIMQAQEKENISSSHVIGLDLSKYYSKLNTTFKINTNYTLSSRIQLLNNALVDIDNTNYSGGLSIASEVNSWLSANYDGSISIYQTQIDAVELQKIYSNRHLLNLYFFLWDDQYLNFGGEYYTSSIIETNANYFLNLGYEYSFSKPKIDLSLHWNNILNTEEFVNISSSEYSYIETSYRLRPSQVLLSLKFSF